MAIPESQLKTWSAQGSIMQSATTYETIKKALNDSASPYYAKDYSIFLQGSYGNNTNVWKDSDVDIIIRLNQTFYSDLSQLEEGAKSSFDVAYPNVQYGFHEFRAQVVDWLTKQFGSDVKPGKKAIFISGNNGRRDSDVLVCAKLRRYRNGSTGTDDQYDEGICFFLPDKTRVTNFPEQHRDNCTAKHQASNEWFKKMVRVYKNIRNRMVEDGYLAEGVAPSYFIEGMLWNVPNGKFGTSFEDSFVDTFNWVNDSDKTQLACANDLYWLIREGGGNCWKPADFETYIAAVKKYWNEWGT
ncbi:MAG: nucleotidyltransferase [Candidatus Accumulibacter phosphatis]|jgi:hypothetical protein|uniref:Nucleotidyltransferase n=1 Tax=Candidatus Accumulibacter contiguus TaxID=2954381 RepID=A0ABX1T305_9PROT|nr:nucleotidyltransferase [Candidatus Accumulibacter contiguus]NMQ04027.1 nucleotidyltransferase [Candidatus Accumulibacter contiguus]